MDSGCACTSAGNRRMYSCSLVSSGVLCTSRAEAASQLAHDFSLASACKTVARHLTNVPLAIISKFAGIFPLNGDGTSQLDVCSWLVLLWLTGPHKLPQL